MPCNLGQMRRFDKEGMCDMFAGGLHPGTGRVTKGGWRCGMAWEFWIDRGGTFTDVVAQGTGRAVGNSEAAVGEP